MNYRKFGNTELSVSEIGFGAWAIGGNAMVGEVAIGWGPAEDTTTIKALHKAVDEGINFFDTADFYGLGHSEKIIGQVLGNRQDVLIATKVGHRAINGKISLDYTKDYIIEACESSLRRLKRETIDYYQLHSARIPHLEAGGCFEAMNHLKKQGKIRYWGLSLNTFDPAPEANFMMAQQQGHGFQLVFNLINQRALPIIREAAAKGFGIIARMPLQFGLLTGKFTHESRFDKDDHRHSRLTPNIIDETLDILHQHVWPLSASYGISETTLALSFILSLSEVSTVIPGIRTPEHVVQNTRHLQKLPDADIASLLSLADTELKPLMKLMEQAG